MQNQANHPLKYNKSAISEDLPSYFKCSYREELKSPSRDLGKKIFPKPAMKNIIGIKQGPRYHSQIHIEKSYLDQDLDSLKLSIRPDITRGYKNTIRFKSNHYKSFFEKIESIGYRRLSTEITSVHNMPKIIRTLKVESSPKPKQNSIIFKKNFFEEDNKNSDINYLFDMKSSKSKQKTLPKINETLKHEDDEIDIFEKKLKDIPFEKSKNVHESYEITRKKIKFI